MSMIDQLAVTHPASFWAHSACRELPADWFHPQRGESTSEARGVCSACAVRPDCLAWALTNNERFGIWGGTSERERRRIRRQLSAGDPVPELDPDWIPTGAAIRPVTAVDPPPEEDTVDLIATPEPATVNGTRPVDPATGLPTDACVNCGKRYTPVKSDQRFCRKECARAWYATHPRSGPVTELACQDCGQKFVPKKTGQRFCSSACAGRYNARNGPRRAGRLTRTAEPAKATAVPAAASPPPAERIDLEQLIAQVLGGCHRWTIEADLGDVHVAISRGQTAH